MSGQPLTEQGHTYYQDFTLDSDDDKGLIVKFNDDATDT